MQVRRARARRHARHPAHLALLGPALHASRRDAGAHPIQVVSAHLECCHRRGAECQCVGRADPIVYRAYCGSCRYWTPVSVDENGAAEAIHDHCWPGWRELPIGTDASRDEHWSQPGAPVITARSRYGTRHVPGRSPYGGYDLSDHVTQGGSGE